MYYDNVLGKHVKVVRDKPTPGKRKHRARSSTVPLPIHWSFLRAIVGMRDGICMDCGNKGHGVHHIDFGRVDNELTNLVYLCRACHRKRHSHRG